MAGFLELAGRLGAETSESLQGRAGLRSDRELRRVSSIEGATPDSIVFSTDSRTLEAAIASAAGAILVRRGTVGGEARMLGVADPRYSFALAARMLRGEGTGSGVHPAAEVAEGVVIGKGSSVGALAVLEEGVVIGEDCVIGAGAKIHAGVQLGDRVVVQAGAVLGSSGFGYVRHPESGEYLLFPQQGSLVIESDVEIGALTTIDRGALGETRIGRGTKIDNLVHIGHNCRIGRNVIIAAQTGISGSSVVEDGAILGGQVGIGEHAMVGPGVILGGGAGVLSGKKMRGSGEVFWGRPARPLREYLKDLAKLRRS